MVNCVSWCPVYHIPGNTHSPLLATASDDHSIRIWVSDIDASNMIKLAANKCNTSTNTSEGCGYSTSSNQHFTTDTNTRTNSNKDTTSTTRIVGTYNEINPLVSTTTLVSEEQIRNEVGTEFETSLNQLSEESTET